MKKWIVLMIALLLALMVCGTAGASGVRIPYRDVRDPEGNRIFYPVESNQYNLILPKGMKLDSESYKPGEISVVIRDKANENGEGTNWLEAIAHTNTGWGDAQIIWQIKVPEFVMADGRTVIPSYANREWDAPEDMEFVVEHFDEKESNISRLTPIAIDPTWGNAIQPNQGNMPYTENGMKVASSIPEIEYLVPLDEQNYQWIGWYDASGTALGYQRLSVFVSHTLSSAFPANVSNEPAEIVPDPNYQPDLSGSTVTYILAQDQTAVTKVKAPEGATHYMEQSGLKGGGSDSKHAVPDDGYIRLSITRSRMDVHAQHKSIKFFLPDGVEKVINVTLKYQYAETVEPCVSYDADFQKMTRDDLIIENGAEDAGYELTFIPETAQLTGGYSGSSTGKAPGTVKMWLKVPDPSITHYEVVMNGGNNVLGRNDQRLNELKDQFIWEYDAPLPVTGDSVLIDVSEPFNTIIPKNDPITIYVPDFKANVLNHADIYAVKWFTEDGSLYNNKIYYFWQTIEKFIVAEKKIPVKQLSDIKEEVTEPTMVAPSIVVPNGRPYEGYQLKIISYLTEGMDAWLYDLTLMDPDGNDAKPNTPVWIYLPFPEGYTPGKKYKINHYTDGLYDSSNLSSAEEIEVQEGLYGLMFQTSSFSPFILSPDDSAPSAPPKTGDNMPLMWLALAAGASACGMIVMMRKKIRKA